MRRGRAHPGRRGRGGWSRAVRAAALAALLLAWPATVAAAGPAPDLAHVVLAPADLPPAFEPSDDAAASFMSLAHALAGGLGSSPDLVDVNPVVLQRTTDAGAEFVTAVLLSPISGADQAAFDATVQQAEHLVRDAIGDSFGDATVTLVGGMRTGVSRLAVSISAPDLGLEYRAVLARRGPVLEAIGHAWTEGVTPVASLEAVAAVLDARLAAAVGPDAPVFRPAGPLVPVLTTHIPSPLDLSTDPAVAGTNLVLAALSLLLLTVSSRLATRMLADHEVAIARRVALVGAIGRAEGRLGAAVSGRVRGRRASETLAFAAVTLFYGLVFSLLEPGWEPLSLTGLWLLASFTIANAVVGMADDLVAWRVARRWDVDASLAIRPAAALVAVASVGLSRVSAVVPGLMFGTPDALRLDEAALGPERGRRLATIGVVALLAVGGAAWAATAITTALAREGQLVNLLAGFEALLLLVFASATQNLFIALLGLRGSVGERLRERSPVAWAAVLLVVTFVFFHALLNPQGDPGAALANRNVQVTLGLVGAFSATVFGAWAILRLAAPSTAPAMGRAPSPVPVAPSAAAAPTPAPDTAAPAAPPPFAPGPALVFAPPSTPGSLVPVAARVGPASAAVAEPFGAHRGLEASIGTADGCARGRATFRAVDGWIVARTRLIDPGARRQLRAFAVLSAAAWVGPFGVVAVAHATPSAPVPFVAGFLGVGLAWLIAMVVARLLLERYAVTHTAVFPATAIVSAGATRDWNLGCALAILLTPLVGLPYLLLAGGRVLRVVAPFAADRPGPVALRLKGSEAEARYLEQLLLSARSLG